MADLTLRGTKGAPLTNDEVDGNFTSLNTAKYESGDSPTFADIIGDTLQFTGGSGTQGTLSWNSDEETVDLIQDGATLQIGQEVQYHVRNNSGSTITDGTPVMATGTIGNSSRITVSPMDGTDIANAKYFLGIAAEDIANNSDGKITFFGKVRSIDTSAYSDGDVLWISTTTAGSLTATEPTSGIKLPIAYVIHAHSNGTIFVRANNGHALHESHDVSITSVTTNDYLKYDGSNWINTSVGNFSSVTTTGDVSVGGDLTVTGNATINGNLTFGDAATDTVAFGADVNSNFIPDVDDAYDLGSSIQEWRNLYIDGTANIDSLVADTADINGGTVDGAIIGGSSAAAGTFTTATATTGNITTLNSTTVDTTSLEVTNLKAKDGTSAGSIADSTGVVTIASSVLTTTDINGGSIDGTTIGSTTASTGNFSTLSIGGTAITATATELNVLDGVTSTTAELNILDGVTSTATELNLLDGVTATTSELNILDGVTSTASELNLVDGSSAGTIVNSKAVVYGAAGEVNATTLQVGGVAITSTPAELNVLDGITATTAELNYTDGVTSNIQTQLDSKANLSGAAFTGAITTTSTIDGRDVSVDGAKLDGIEAGATADQTASEILTAVKTVDGTGSGLDADLLDGQHGSYYTGYTDTAVANLVDSAPATLDTLNELAAALGDDANFSTTVTNSIALKAPIASPTFTGTATIPTADINGGTIDGAVIGGSSAAAITGTTGQFNTSLNVDGTVTADGLTVDNNSSTPMFINRDQAVDGYGIVLNQADTTNGNGLEISYQTTTTGTVTPNTLFAGIDFTADEHDWSTREGSIQLKTAKGGVGYKTRMNVGGSGDISFYEDTGTTAKLFWDASAESLGIGTSSPSGLFSLAKGSRTLDIKLEDTAATGDVGVQLRAGSGDFLGFAAGGGTGIGIVLDSSNNVGIGTTSPSAQLHIASTGASNIALEDTDNGFAATELNIENGGRDFKITTPQDTIFVQGSTESMRIDTSGKVGIGTTSPSKKLVISDNGAMGVEISPDDGGNGYSRIINYDRTTNQYEPLRIEGEILQFSTGTTATEKVRIDSSGRVGIGTTSPSASHKLDVIGDVRIADSSPRLEMVDTDISGIWYIDGGSNTLIFQNNANERLRIDSSGNVGIGTSSPIYTAASRTTATINGASSANLSFGIGGTGYASLYVDSLSVEFGSQTSANPVKFTIGGTEKMRIDSSGNLLVGQSSSITPGLSNTTTGLSLTNSGYIFASKDNDTTAWFNRNTSDGNIVSFRKDGTAVGSIGTFGGYPYIGGSGTTDSFIRFWNASQAAIYPATSTGATNDAAINIGGSSQRFKNLYLSGSAYAATSIGIGTTSPQNLLHINKSDSSASAIQFTNSTTGATSSDGVFVGLGSGEQGYLWNYENNDVILGTNNTERLRIDSSGTLSLRDAPAGNALQFGATSGGTYTERARIGINASDGLDFAVNGTTPDVTIDTSGNLLAGKTTTSATSGGGVVYLGRVDAARDDGDVATFKHTTAGNTVGSISITSSATAYNTSSDARLKENIADADDAGSKIDAIQVRQFDWKADGSHQDYGMIAQELVTVAPEAVQQPEDPEEMMGVDYSKLVPMLVKEIQSLRARMAQLEGGQ